MRVDNYDKPIIDPVLTFVVFALDSSPLGYVTNTLVQFYTVEELTRAKDLLWETADHDVIGVYTKRRDGATRSVSDIIASDITGAIQKLDIAGSVPNVVVNPMGLNRIPKVTPSETNALSMCERLAAVENRVRVLEVSVSENVCKTAVMEEKVEQVKSYASVVSSKSPVPPRSIMAGKTVPSAPPLPNGQLQSSGSSRGVTSEDERRPHPDDARKTGGYSRSRKNILRQMKHHGVSRSTSQLSLASGTSQVSAPFEYQRAARKKRRPVAVVGTSSSENVRGAPEPSRDLFVYRVLDGNIEDYITEHNIEGRNLERISKDGSRFMSFKVTVKV